MCFGISPYYKISVVLSSQNITYIRKSVNTQKFFLTGVYFFDIFAIITVKRGK